MFQLLLYFYCQPDSASACANMGADWVTGEDISENIVALQALGSGVRQIANDYYCIPKMYIVIFQTFWTDAELTPQGTYNFSDGTVVVNSGVPLDPQSGRPLVVFAKKDFIYQRNKADRTFFALCRTDMSTINN